MRIEVSQLPPVEYSLNWRGHWAQRYQAGKAYQSAVFYSCLEARNKTLLAGGSIPLVAKGRVNLTFVFPQRRRRDKDNLIARFKPGLDGIVQAHLVVDDDAEHLELSNVDIVVDPERAPLTVIDIEELEGRKNGAGKSTENS